MQNLFEICDYFQIQTADIFCETTKRMYVLTIKRCTFVEFLFLLKKNNKIQKKIVRTLLF